MDDLQTQINKLIDRIAVLENASGISADTVPDAPDIMMDPESFEMVGAVPETENKEDNNYERKNNL